MNFSPERRASLRAEVVRLAENHSQREIARRVGVCNITVARILSAAGVSSAGTKFGRVLDDDVNWTPAQIAAMHAGALADLRATGRQGYPSLNIREGRFRPAHSNDDMPAAPQRAHGWEPAQVSLGAMAVAA